MEGGTRQAAAVGSTTRQRIEGFKIADTLADVHFEFDRYDLTAEATQALDANAAWLKANPRHLVLIEGHCDERGTVGYNLALGERRAKATQNYLAAQGIQAGRVLDRLVRRGKAAVLGPHRSVLGEEPPRALHVKQQ